MRSVPEILTVFWTKYISGGVLSKELADNPYDQFESWAKDAVERKSGLPNAMNLAMEDFHGKSYDRIVIIRGFYDRKFVFFTNYDVKNTNDLKNISNASMTLFWSNLFRRVRITGDVHQISKEESEKYLSGLPYISQISPQVPEKINTPEKNGTLNENRRTKKIHDKDSVVPPDSWRGFYLSPKFIEFCHGRTYLLHYRVRYRLGKNNSWNIKRLFPPVYYG
jgi:pyridoxamine 5'-phosphate oxidase